MSKLLDLTMAQARDGLKARDFSAVELTTAYIEQVESARALNAFVLETPEKALKMASASDKSVERIWHGSR